MLYRVIVGDWSDDGHGKTQQFDLEITSDHTVEQLQENYRKNCERWGTSLDKVCRDYEDSDVDIELYEKMKDDGAKWTPDSVIDALDTSVDLGPWDALDFVMDFIGCGLEPALEWRNVESQATLLIGGFGAKIEKSFGYGLFYS